MNKVNFKLICLFAISAILSASCSDDQKTIELPLKQQKGYGYFNSSMGGISTYSVEAEDHPWKKPYLKVTSAPKNWTDITYGDIETNIYQSVYQNYLLGILSKERYEELQKSWDWQPDTLQLSKEPLKTRIAFAYVKDSTGIVNMILDANNNLDFSDDKSFIPSNFSISEKINRDSIARIKAIDVSFERFINNKKQLHTAPLFIAYIAQANMFMCNFSQYSIADFNGEKIAVCSDAFTNLSYNDPSIFLMDDSLKDGDKINRESLTAKDEYIEIKGEIYKNTGVNINSNTLVLEKIGLPKSELQSTQIGYQSFSFEGKDFMAGTSISSQQLKGKYVLLDFWAVWCKPCREELPYLKELYKKTDRKNFEIIGIVGESDPKLLKEMIEKDSITWTQVLSSDSNKINETFGVQGYPTSFLISPEGLIVAKNLRGKELEEKILVLINETKTKKHE